MRMNRMKFRMTGWTADVSADTYDSSDAGIPAYSFPFSICSWIG